MDALICQIEDHINNNLCDLVKRSEKFNKIIKVNSAEELEIYLNNHRPKFIFIKATFFLKQTGKKLLDLLDKQTVILVFEHNVNSVIQGQVIELSKAILRIDASKYEIQILVETILQNRLKVSKPKKLKVPYGNPPNLTKREIEILHLLSKGKGNLEISKTLKIEIPTTKTHLQRLFRKLAVSDRTHGVAQAIRWRII